ILEREVACIAGTNSKLAVDSAGRKPFHRALDDETRHSTMIPVSSLLFIGPAKEQKIIGDIGQADPHLLTIQHPLIAISSSCRSRAHHVRACAWFSQPVG